MLLKSLISTFFLLDLFLAAKGLIYEATLKNAEKDWIFLGKFCFISEKGRIEYSISYPASYGSINLLFYYDLEWTNIYRNIEKSCDTKEQEISSNRILNLTIAETNNGCALDESDPNNHMIRCTSSRRFLGSRPRYWFMVASNCFPAQNYKGIDIDYKFVFTNGDGIFVHHFSADEFGIYESSISMFVFYFLLMLLASLYAFILLKKHLFHITFKLFMASIMFQFLKFMFYLIDYGQASTSGKPLHGILILARIFGEISETIFLVMLILIAKGYTVTRGRLRKITWIKLVILFMCYLLAILVVFLYSEILFDPGVVNYFYNSAGGIALIAIRLIFGWLWFCYSIFFTIKNYPEKRKFYVIMLIYFSLWFWASPLVILSSTYFIVDHVRQFVGYLITSLILLLGHSIFLLLTRPTTENKTFPYHYKTNSVGLLNKNEDGPLNYPHHQRDKGGNTEFESLQGNNVLVGLFTTENSRKYILDPKVLENNTEMNDLS